MPRLTAELSNAQGVNAWPIVTYMYLFLRKSTLRRGATCAYVKENVAFWQWFLSADVAREVVKAWIWVFQLQTLGCVLFSNLQYVSLIWYDFPINAGLQ